MTIRPYYSDKYCTLYHGDNREILPQLGTFDLCLTDPPYSHQHMGGGGFAAARRFYAGGALEGLNDFDLEQYKQALISTSEMLIAFCSRDLIADYSALSRETKRKFDLHVWYKTNAIPFTANTWKSDIEYIALLWSRKPGWKQFDQKEHSKVYMSPICSDRLHPACKPIPLMMKYIKVYDPKTIIDPFAGSGTVGRASKNLRRHCTMIEWSEKYCEIIVKRMLPDVETQEELAI